MRNFHWTAISGFHHEKLGDYIGSYYNKSDKLIECMLGMGYTLDTRSDHAVADHSVNAELLSFLNYLDSLVCEVKYGPIVNILDEMMTDLLRLSYLLSKN